MKESTLAADCRLWLDLRGCILIQTHSGYRKPVECGIPDLMGCTRTGRAIVVETKTPAGKLSPDQEWSLSRFREKGAIVIVAHCLNELIAEYERQTCSGWDTK